MLDRIQTLRAAMGDRNIRRVELAYLGFNMAEFATWIAILVYAFGRGGAAEAGLASVILLVPSAVVAPFAAYAGDRFRRDRVLAIDYLVQAFALGATALALSAEASVGIVYATAALASISITFTRPAQSSLIPSLTERPEDLTAANVATGIVEGIGKMLGPIAAGVLLGARDVATVFAVFAVVSLLGAISVFGLRVQQDMVTPPTGRVPRMWHETLGGFRTLQRASEPRLVILLLASGVIVVGALDVLFVATAIDLLGIGASGAGYLSAAFGAGAIVGAASTVALVGRRRLTPHLAVGAVVFGVPTGLVAAFPSALTASLLFAVAGGGRSVGDVAGRTLLQRIAPDEVLSRVFGVLEGLTMLALAAGSVASAVLIESFGVEVALAAVGAFLPLVVLVTSGRLLSIDRSAEAPDAEILSVLRAIPFFAQLPAPAMERVMANVSRQEANAGELLIREGDHGDRFYVVVEGGVEVTRGGEHVAELGAGDYVGEIALLRDVPRTASVRATTAVRLLTLEREPFLLAVTGHPASHETAHAVADERTS